MKLLALIAILFTLQLAAATPHQTETVLSTCKRFPAFSVDQVRYRTEGPEVYGTFYFDLNYIEHQHVLLLVVDDYGQPTYQKEIDRDLPRSQHFEVNERVGNADYVARDVRAYLKGQQIYVCGS